MFDRMTHADWSINASKRWAASARRQQDTWSVSRPAAIPDTSSFLDDASNRLLKFSLATCLGS
jgi:hypothetical protein